MPVTNFVRGSNPVWSFVDLDGNQFDDTFYMWVLVNEIPYFPVSVYHDPSGLIPWADPIQFLANGTLPVDIFWDDSMVYRLEFRQNNGLLPPSQSDPLIYLVENYIPAGGGGSPGQLSGLYTSNQVSNPQFAVVNFESPLVLTNVTNPPPIQIAPDWFLTLVGTGSVTFQQIPLNNTLPNPTNAPYALRLLLSGLWTTNPILSQTFSQNGMLWANQYVAASITAMTGTAPFTITCRLDASNGATVAVLMNPTITNTFTEYTGSALLPATLNPNTPPNAALTYKIVLPTTCDLYITSIQLVESDSAGIIDYEQETVDRQLDHLAHYYQPQLAYKPIPSYLVGWDFPLNPAQLGAAQGPFATANNSNYVWDQTIVYQSATDAFTTARATDGSLSITTAGAASQIAVIQYLDGPQVQELLNNNLSVYLAMNSSAAVSGTVSLWANSALPTLPAGIVASLDATGFPATFNQGGGAWVQIPRLIMQNASFNITQTVATSYQEATFSGWVNSNAALITSSNYFAIVIGFASIPAATTININAISLNIGNIATRPAPKTYGETLQDCERYYFDTFAIGTAPAQGVGEQTGEFAYPSTNINGTTIYSPELLFPTYLRHIPTVTTYNPNAANAQVLDETAGGSCSATTTYNLSKKGVNIRCTGSSAPNTSVGNLLGVHISADARLGVV